MSFIQKWLNDFIRAYDRRTEALKGGNLQILSALVEIEERLEEHMASDEVMLQQILNKLTAVEVGVVELASRVNQAQENNPALADEFAGIQETITKIQGDLAASLPATPVVPEPTPVPEPAPTPAPISTSPS